MDEPAGESYDVFLSYSRRDAEVMRRLRDDLRAAGVSVWVDDIGLEPGTPIWEAEVQKALEQARSLVVVLSPAAKSSRWVGRELTYGDEHGVPIFPFLVAGDATSAIPLRLISSQWIDAREDYSAGLRSLLEALSNRLRASLSLPEPAVAVPPEERLRIAVDPELERQVDACIGSLAGGRPAEAWETYRNTLRERLFHRAAFTTAAALLEGLLRAEDGDSPLATEERLRIMAEAARARSWLGDPRGAVERLSAQTGELPAVALVVRGTNQMLLGHLAAAEKDLRAALEAGDSAAVTAEARLELGRLLDIEGREAEAAAALEESARTLEQVGSDVLEVTALIYRGQRFWTTGASQAAVATANAALDAADYLGSLPLLARACWLLASIYLSQASIGRIRDIALGQAQRYLERAREICRDVTLPEIEPDLQLAMARALRVAGRTRQARTVAERGVAMASAAGYRLKEADLEGLLAKLAVESGDRAAAQRHAIRARELALCDGGRGSYARGILHAAGAARQTRR